MHVFNAVQNFRNDASFLVVTENDPQFGHVLKNFIEQQRQLDGSLAEKVIYFAKILINFPFSLTKN